MEHVSLDKSAKGYRAMNPKSRSIAEAAALTNVPCFRCVVWERWICALRRSDGNCSLLVLGRMRKLESNYLPSQLFTRRYGRKHHLERLDYLITVTKIAKNRDNSENSHVVVEYEFGVIV